jgi:hypothetical protein
MSNIKTMATQFNPVSFGMNMNPASMNNRSIVPRTVMCAEPCQMVTRGNAEDTFKGVSSSAGLGQSAGFASSKINRSVFGGASKRAAG